MRSPTLSEWLTFDGPPPIDSIAEWFGAEPNDVEVSLGRRWFRVREGYAEEGRSYFVIGEPHQVVLGLGTDDAIVFPPTGEVFGVVRGVAAREPVRIKRSRRGAIGYLATAIRETAVSRRRAFRWCPSCMRPTPPERWAGTLCGDCMPDDPSILF